MSDMDSTKFFYKEKNLDLHVELDYLDTEIVNIDLNSVGEFIVSRPFVFRPDLISFQLFGSYNYGWLLSIHNGFLDPINEFVLGKKILIPDINQYFRFYNQNSYSRSRKKI